MKKFDLRDIIYYFNCIIFPPAKVFFMIWTAFFFYELSLSKSSGNVAVYILGLIIFIPAIDLIYYFRHPLNYRQYKVKILQKRLALIKKRMDNYLETYVWAGEIQSTYGIEEKKAYEILNALRKFQYCEENNSSKKPDKLLKSRLEAFQFIENRYNLVPQNNPALNQINYDLMDGHTFEYYCAEILGKNGFINVEVTRGSGDHGIDILAEKNDISYAIQCKCYSSNIGNAAVQQAHTGKSLYHKDIAVVLTNQYFTAQAKEEAGALGVKLWDRDKLNQLIENAN